MTQELKNKITKLIGPEFVNAPVNKLRIVIEDTLDVAKANTIGFVGESYSKADIIISKEENNRLHEIRALYSQFMYEMEEKLTN